MKFKEYLCEGWNGMSWKKDNEEDKNPKKESSPTDEETGKCSWFKTLMRRLMHGV